MKTRPKTLSYLAYALIAIALSLPLQIMLRYGDMPWEVSAIFNKLAPLNWAIIGIGLFEALLLWNASPWVWFVAPSFLITVFWNNWLVATLGTPEISMLSCAASLLAVGIHAALVSTPTRKLLSEPSMRWWKTPKRKKLSANATIYPTEGGELVSQVVNISESGVFLATPERPEKHTALSATSNKGAASKLRMNKTLKVGSYCSIKLKLAKGISYSCNAKVVRQSLPSETHPAGFGLCFVSMTPQERRNLEGFLRAL